MLSNLQTFGDLQLEYRTAQFSKHFVYIIYVDIYCQLCYNIYKTEPKPATHILQATEDKALAEKRVSAAQRRATDKYLEKFDDIRVRVPAGQKEELKAHAAARDESLNAFIVRAISQTVERDNAQNQ